MEKLNGKMRDRDWSKTIAVAAAAVLVGLLAAYFAQGQALAAARIRISAAYQKAFYETCELMEGMAVNLRKLLVAGGAQEQELLGEIARQAEGAQNNLAALPLGGDVVAGSMKFVNQAGDFAASLSARLAAGGAVSEADQAAISKLSASADGFSAGMSGLLSRYEAGETVFTAEDFQPAEGQDLYPLSNPASQYPVLLYDGPFSDGRADGRMRALEGLEEISSDEAMRRLTGFLRAGEMENITLEGESAIPVECYEFSFTADGYRMNAGITKRGGKVLYMLTADSITERNIPEAQAVQAAEQFLQERGFGEMEMSYFSRHEGVLIVNFAAVQDGVVLYPDLAKVQVSLRDGAVVGLEAANYLNNHVLRDLPEPVLTREEALEKLGPQLEGKSVRLCVIPENNVEYLCYEIAAAHGEEDFLVYIDALAGTERGLMQVIRDENGTLVM